MARGGNKKKALEARLVELELKKRNGLMRAIASFVGLAVLIWLKLTFEMQGAAWASSMMANLTIFVLAVVAAGIAGIGTRDWSRAKKEIASIESKLYK